MWVMVSKYAQNILFGASLVNALNNVLDLIIVFLVEDLIFTLQQMKVDSMAGSSTSGA